MLARLYQEMTSEGGAMERSEVERLALARGWLAHQAPAFQAAVLSRSRTIAIRL